MHEVQKAIARGAGKVKMKKRNTIGRKLSLLILIATIPALIILLISGMEQRRKAMTDAENNVLFLVHTMSDAQVDMTRSAKQLLATLSLFPEFQKKDVRGCSQILKDVLKENPDYLNITLVDTDGKVVASGVPVNSNNLGDRKHFHEALAHRKFAAGEYIVSRTSSQTSSFPYAFPILDDNDRPTAVLTAVVKLSQFSRFYEGIAITEKSFVAITDYQGKRLLYYPPNEKTNPLGQPIKEDAWNWAAGEMNAGIFKNQGSDGIRRINGFEPVRLSPDSTPYSYIWAGVPEKEILQPIYKQLTRNLIFMLLFIVLSLLAAWSLGKRVVIKPIEDLVELTMRLGRGDILEEPDQVFRNDEFGTLNRAFYEMAGSLETNRKTLEQNEARLLKETEQLMITLKSIGDGVFTTDADGRVVLLNKAAEVLTGWNNHDAAGQDSALVFKIINQETRQAPENPVARVLSSGNPVSLNRNTILISKTGQEYSIADRGAPIKDAEGHILGVIVVFRDITSQLKMEQEMIRVNKLESIGTLAGGIAHDFNNILMVILGNIEMALGDKRMDPATLELLNRALEASDRAKGLTSQLLTFAKGGEPFKERLSVGELVRNSADLALTSEKTVCRCSFAPDILPIEADKALMGQVVQNIVFNACNVMPMGGQIDIKGYNALPEETNERHLAPGRLYVRLDFSDQGPGISEELLEKIFDPYFSTEQQRSGLGLAISHSIVTKHGGKIFAESRHGSGTSITIFLPAVTEEPTKGKAPEQLSPGKEDICILVMDDEEMIRNILDTMLRSLGHQVLVSRDGQEAIELYKKSGQSGPAVDLMIMDLTVPNGMGGKEASGKILEINPDMKIIVSSGYSDDPVMADWSRYGFAGAIKKPYTLRELHELLDRVLS
jgi:two-component system cell cycle sensor histidine kinase/response regulator CckA